jgi:hypothetical protein
LEERCWKVFRTAIKTSRKLKHIESLLNCRKNTLPKVTGVPARFAVKQLTVGRILSSVNLPESYSKFVENWWTS